MWERDEAEGDEKTEAPEAGPEAPSRGERPDATPGADRAIIGAAIRIQGEVTGDGDLTIHGSVDGSVDLDQHAVAVGSDGAVDGDVTGRAITVAGRVDGDLEADEQVVLHSSARVTGDISAPRVVLEDGAYFRGGVDMGEPPEEGRGRDAAAPGTRDRGSGRDGASPGPEDESADQEAGEGEAAAETAT